MLKNILIILFLSRSFIHSKKNLVEEKKKDTQTFKISEKKIQQDDINQLRLKSRKCTYYVKFQIKKFIMEKSPKGIKANYLIKISEKLLSKYKKIKISEFKSEKKLTTESQLNIKDFEDVKLEQGEILIFPKDIYWKLKDEKEEKLFKRSNFLSFPLDKENEVQNPFEVKYELKKVPCDTLLPNIQLEHSSFSKSVVEDKVLLMFPSNTEVLDFYLKFSISFLKKFHVGYNRNQFKKVWCEGRDFEKLKFRSMKYRNLLCQTRDY